MILTNYLNGISDRAYCGVVWCGFRFLLKPASVAGWRGYKLSVRLCPSVPTRYGTQWYGKLFYCDPINFLNTLIIIGFNLQSSTESRKWRLDSGGRAGIEAAY